VKALVIVGRTDGVAVAVGDAPIGAMLRGHGPWTLVAAAMLHALGWRLGLDVGADTDAGGPRGWSVRRRGGLRGGRRAVGGDGVLVDVYGWRSGDAM
jgi:hypothetical protein